MLAVELVEHVYHSLAAIRFGDADLAAVVDPLFAEGTTFIEDRRDEGVCAKHGRIGVDAGGGDGKRIAGEGIAVCDDHGRDDVMDRFEGFGCIDPGDETFLFFDLGGEVGDKIGPGQGGDLG